MYKTGVWSRSSSMSLLVDLRVCGRNPKLPPTAHCSPPKLIIKFLHPSDIQNHETEGKNKNNYATSVCGIPTTRGAQFFLEVAYSCICFFGFRDRPLNGCSGLPSQSVIRISLYLLKISITRLTASSDTHSM